MEPVCSLINNGMYSKGFKVKTTINLQRSEHISYGVWRISWQKLTEIVYSRTPNRYQIENNIKRIHR